MYVSIFLRKMREQEVSEIGFLVKICLGIEVGPGGDLHGGSTVFPACECIAIGALPLIAETSWQHTEL